MRATPLALAALLLLLCACQNSDGTDVESVSAVAVAGQDLIVDAGYCRVEISRLAIGSGTGQLPAGSRVKIETIGFLANGITAYSNLVRITATNAAGAAVTGLNLSPAANVFLRFDFSAASRDGHDETDLKFVVKSGSSFTSLTHAATAAAGSTFATPAQGSALALMTSFSDMAVAFGTPSGGGGGGGTPTALTGSISTLLTFTSFSLNNTGSTITANLIIPTSDTTGLPKVLTLNDAAFDAGNPTAATNKILTVTTGGKTYTTDKAGASITATLTTFAGSNSSGTLIGTVVDNASTATLAINYTFTTGSAGATALTGTVSDFGGRRTVTLRDTGNLVTVLFLMPDTLPSTPPSSVTFDDASFDSSNPTAVSGRVLTVTEGGTTYSSDVPVLGNVTVNFTTFSSGTSTGTITGTAVSTTPSTKTLNYTFSTTPGAAGGGTGTLANAAPVTVAASDDALESAIVASGAGYLGFWLSAVGTTNRTIQMRPLDATGTPTGTQTSVEPSVNLAAAGRFSAAIEPGGIAIVAGATGSSASTDTVRLTVINTGTSAILFEHNLGTGTAPRVVYNSTASLFVCAFTTASGVSVTTLPATGASFATALALHSGATLAGLASAGAADEVLVTANDSSGIRARRVTPSTLTALGSAFDVTTSLGGGLCLFDAAGSAYLIAVQEQGTLLVNQIVRQLPVGSDTLHATKLTLIGITAMSQGATSTNSSLLSDASATFHAARANAGGPTQIGSPIVGFVSGLALDTTSDGAAMAGNGAGAFVALAARGAGAGVSSIRFTVTP